MDLLVLSYEFTYSPFSGNGVLARSLVKGLLRHNCRCLVICCRPAKEHATKDNPILSPEVSHDQAACLSVQAIELPAAVGWRRLDRESGWQFFAQGAMGAVSRGCAQKAWSLEPKAICVIDWSGGAAWRAIRSERAFEALHSQPPPALYINFRVYSSGLTDAEAAAWHDAREREALEVADSCIVLSKTDERTLRTLIGPDHSLDFEVFYPCLRGARRPARRLCSALLPRPAGLVLM